MDKLSWRSLRALDGRSARAAVLRLLREGATFGAVGVTATLVHVTVALVLNGELDLAPLTANFLAYCTAVGVSYFGNARLTFRARAWHGLQFASFAAASLTSLALSQGVIYVAVHLLALSFATALLLAVAFVTPISFLLNKVWVFGRNPPLAVTPDRKPGVSRRRSGGA